MTGPGEPAIEPTLSVAMVSRELTAEPSTWRITWEVSNQGALRLQIREAWLPHGRFRCPRQAYDPPLTVEPGSSEKLAFPVECQGEPGAVVENCFVILNLKQDLEDWRVFARITVSFGADSAPDPETVVITTQRIGFSG